jgi:hypothetical protein
LGEFGFLVRDALPCWILFGWPRGIGNLKEVKRTGFGTPIECTLLQTTRDAFSFQADSLALVYLLKCKELPSR